MVEIRNKTNNNKRIIKFRVWIKDLNKMYNVEGLNNLHKSIDILLENSYYKAYSNVNYNDCELMQYTGFNDKNGKEIYEGDIVHLDYENDCEYIVNWDNDHLSYCLYVGNVSDMFLCDWESKDIEVIGNIYENPELLQEIKK